MLRCFYVKARPYLEAREDARELPRAMNSAASAQSQLAALTSRLAAAEAAAAAAAEDNAWKLVEAGGLLRISTRPSSNLLLTPPPLCTPHLCMSIHPELMSCSDPS